MHGKHRQFELLGSGVVQVGAWRHAALCLWAASAWRCGYTPSASRHGGEGWSMHPSEQRTAARGCRPCLNNKARSPPSRSPIRLASPGCHRRPAGALLPAGSSHAAIGAACPQPWHICSLALPTRQAVGHGGARGGGVSRRHGCGVGLVHRSVGDLLRRYELRLGEPFEVEEQWATLDGHWLIAPPRRVWIDALIEQLRRACATALQHLRQSGHWQDGPLHCPIAAARAIP
mmetsp:Transcript_19962/g.40625  ORF Transcript_19962/g.40625 Transcript_19962/m.40625 type:complete len:231 (-) Transcript_19962:999-1691(-)